jgi:hypothetical protein
MDYSGGEHPATWIEAVHKVRDEMATHVVIVSTAQLFSLNIHILDWNGV